MTARSKTVLAGSLVGTISGLLIALSVMPLIPFFARGMRDTTSEYVSWAIALGSPMGFMVGGASGAFLAYRAKHVDAFARLFAEIVVIAAVIVGILIQFMLPFRWPLPRVAISAIACVVASVLAALGAVVLKPLYWRQVPIMNLPPRTSSHSRNTLKD